MHKSKYRPLHSFSRLEPQRGDDAIPGLRSSSVRAFRCIRRVFALLSDLASGRSRKPQSRWAPFITGRTSRRWTTLAVMTGSGSVMAMSTCLMPRLRAVRSSQTSTCPPAALVIIPKIDAISGRDVGPAKTTRVFLTGRNNDKRLWTSATPSRASVVKRRTLFPASLLEM